MEMSFWGWFNLHGLVIETWPATQAVTNRRWFLGHPLSQGNALRTLKPGPLGLYGASAQASVWCHVTRVFALSDGRSVGRALVEINFRGQRFLEAGWCVGYPYLCYWGRGPPSPKVCDRAPGVRVRVSLCAGGGSPGSGGERRGSGGGGEREQGAGVIEGWMMMILVVLRLQRFLRVKVVKPKLHLLLFRGLLFLQCLEFVFLQLLQLYWTMTTLLLLAASLLSPSFHHQRLRMQTTALSIKLFLKHSNGTIAHVDEAENPGANVSNIQLQQKISNLEIKLKVSEEEKQRIKKDVESLIEKHSILEKDFLKEKEQDAISFQDRYKELQVNLVYLQFNM
ncbi:PREDICTED: uncharacterized protein LOC109396300 [Hipposideros armiger]|uniref:Uncharacterized protein LOC109396300 n=1 Tax=Hipposideros armiger TaxID=186990 RepID=A0A8B7TCU8_HIPAR|nr:PREDICTED: uncharacterized protein LOC109396300 [Hipposideros armiger]